MVAICDICEIDVADGIRVLMLKQKVMMLCYQMAALRNKQVSGIKTAVVNRRIPSVDK
ncbi:hypothetical protein RhiirA4_481446 [Rhizophagus irregularis]|uniref:Uncharacterized protein n=1 Tax=Rhizophagus irregularis TaxID=588596 RepID=A0A2I1HJG4_9GLOM|nr:hypothetical protein RhiirA4_481446 [Rhizophagus irregularis]